MTKPGEYINNAIFPGPHKRYNHNFFPKVERVALYKFIQVNRDCRSMNAY